MAMERGWWDSPVPVMLPNRPMVHHVSNNEQAAEFLLFKWPTDTGKRFRLARQAVLSSMQKAQDRVALAKARKAFAEAAKEADILME